MLFLLVYLQLQLVPLTLNVLGPHLRLELVQTEGARLPKYQLRGLPDLLRGHLPTKVISAACQLRLLEFEFALLVQNVVGVTGQQT